MMAQRFPIFEKRGFQTCVRWIPMVLLCATACNKDDARPDCGCAGADLHTLKQVRARYLGDDFFVVQQVNEGGKTYLTTLKACDQVDSKIVISSDSTTFPYQISGGVKKQCPDGVQTLIAVPASFRLDQITEN